MTAPASEPRHVVAAAAMFEALGSGDWDRAASVWETRLTRLERAKLLGYAIRVCALDDAVAMMDAALADLAPGPPVPFGPLRDSAEAWVAFATAAERKAYLLACFHALGPVDQVNFLRAVQKKVLSE